MKENFCFLPAGIGSLPYQDTKTACQMVLKYLAEIPFWPQLPQRSFLEGMTAQFSEGLPGIKIDVTAKRIRLETSQANQGLEQFYEHFLKQDLDYFAISPDYAPGLYEMMRILKPRRHEGTKNQFFKGQVTGPITFGMGLLDETGKVIIHNETLADLVVKILTMKALWQVKTFRDSLGLKSIIFLDEPGLTGYGSAYVSINRETVQKQLIEIIDALHKVDALVGLHCCGNTDWAMLLGLPIDIISFDAYGFTDKFLLYPKDIRGFIERGGIIAWGIVPTTEYKTGVTAEDLIRRLNDNIARLAKKGIERDLIINHSLITSSCGLGTMSEGDSERVLSLLKQTSAGMRAE